MLSNEEATRTGILEGLQWLVDNVKDGDTVMVFASTYALVDSRDNFYLGSHEVLSKRPRSTGVAWRDLTDTLHFDLPDCKRMVFLDLRATASAIRPGIRSPLLDLASPAQGTTFLSSNTLQETADVATDQKHSVFMTAMLETIRDKRFDVAPKNGDSLFNPVELATGVTKLVHQKTQDGQHPVFYSPDQVRVANVLELKN